MLGDRGCERARTASVGWLGKEVEAGAPPAGGYRNDKIGSEEARASPAC